MGGKDSNQRARLVVEPEIQYTLVSQLCGQWCLHLVASLVLLTMLQVLLGGFFRPWAEHLEQVWPMLASLTISLACLLPVYIRSSLKLSNRFVGPIHRFRKELRAIASGQEYSPIEFRDKDYWPTFAKEFDAAVKAIQAKADANRRASTDSTESTESTESTGAPGGGVVFPGADTTTGPNSTTP